MNAISSNWLTEAAEIGFGIDHLPIGVAEFSNGPVLVVAIGRYAINLASLSAAGLLTSLNISLANFTSGNLNKFLSLGAKVHRELRSTLQNYILSDADLIKPHLHKRENLAMLCPLAPGDFIDFYSSLAHAERCSHLPNNEHALSKAWKSMPLAYHSRAGAILANGSQINRPLGQVSTKTGVKFRPTRMLDFEMELGFVIRQSTDFGQCLAPEDFTDYVFGVVLLNDWSARDFQGYEAKPLGPFHSKSFATQVSNWVTPIEALEPFRCNKVYDKPVLTYLKEDRHNAYNLKLSASITSKKMQESRFPPLQIADCKFQEIYWSPSQQLAHLTANGAPIKAGDLFGSGTISGELEHQMGCLLERVADRLPPIILPDRSTRVWLKDGDKMIFECSAQIGGNHVTLGPLEGSVASALKSRHISDQ